MPDRELCFFLEWDRGTENARRLESIVRGYLRYFDGRLEADRHHVLFLVPSFEREREVRQIIDALLRRRAGQCLFATSTAELLVSQGPVDRIWLSIGMQERAAFDSMAGVDRSSRSADDCIGKPAWWERRTAGGEGA